MKISGPSLFVALASVACLTPCAAANLRGSIKMEIMEEDVEVMPGSRMAFEVFASTVLQGGTITEVDNESAWKKVKSLQCFFLQKDKDTCISTVDVDNDTIVCSYCELSKEKDDDGDGNTDEGPTNICVPSFAAETLLEKGKAIKCDPPPYPLPIVPPPIEPLLPITLPPPPGSVYIENVTDTAPEAVEIPIVQPPTEPPTPFKHFPPPGEKVKLQHENRWWMVNRPLMKLMLPMPRY
jgi:hypothetical protein